MTNTKIEFEVTGDVDRDADAFAAAIDPALADMDDDDAAEYLRMLAAAIEEYAEQKEGGAS